MLSFIVPAHNEELLLGRTLSALHESVRALGEPYEIVVVDEACWRSIAFSSPEVVLSTSVVIPADDSSRSLLSWLFGGAACRRLATTIKTENATHDSSDSFMCFLPVQRAVSKCNSCTASERKENAEASLQA